MREEKEGFLKKLFSLFILCAKCEGVRSPGTGSKVREL